MDNNGKTGSDIEATRPVLWYNRVPVWSINGGLMFFWFKGVSRHDLMCLQSGTVDLTDLSHCDILCLQSGTVDLTDQSHCDIVCLHSGTVDLTDLSHCEILCLQSGTVDLTD